MNMGTYLNKLLVLVWCNVDETKWGFKLDWAPSFLESFQN
jgi:hypothetical protein